MIIRKWGYFLKSALTGMCRNGFMTLASLATVTCCLILFGVFMLFSVNINFIGRQIQSQCEIQAYIDIDADAAQEQAVVAAINSMDNLASATFVSKDDAIEEYREFLGVDASALDGLSGDDFLRSSVRIVLSDLHTMDEFVAQLSQIPNVAEVVNRRDIVERIISVTDVIRNGSFIAMLILIIVAIFIISNTIELSVHSREDEIHIMKYVGATDRFIRWPFVIEGMLTGLLGGAISLLLVAVGYDTAVSNMLSFLDIFELLRLGAVLPWLAAFTLVFGAVMGTLGSAFAITRHLKV
ncbi:MAG: permease-like cell division protein FtsX [Clostridia bacterium]|nr:permease-like cell division protein FtsX [Clostridia bacterium]